MYNDLKKVIIQIFKKLNQNITFDQITIVRLKNKICIHIYHYIINSSYIYIMI